MPEGWIYRISPPWVRALVLCWLGLLVCFARTAPADAPNQVALQLSCRRQFQGAGYYAALHNGHYRQAGLDVRIVEGGREECAYKEVLGGRAQYGVGGAELVIQRVKGRPLVVLASLFQHSPSILLARRDSGITTLRDLAGKRVRLLPGRQDADILAAFLNAGIPIDTLQRIDQACDVNDLLQGRIDAISASITTEPWNLEQAGVAPAIISPRTYGVDFYGGCLFTTEQEIENHPARVKKFLEASLRGWQEALDRPEAVIDLLLAERDMGKKRDHLRYQAEAVRDMMVPDLVQIGYMNPDRWRCIAESYARLGMMAPDPSLKGFLYDPRPEREDHRITWTVGVALAISLVLSIGSLILLAFNKKRLADIQARRRVEEALRSSEEKLRNIVEHSSNLFYSHSTEHELTYLSPQCREFLQCDPQEAMIRWTTFATDNPINARGFALTEKAIRTGKPQAPYELELKGKKGKKILVEVRESPVVRDGKTVEIVGSLTDITERKRTERALRESEEKYRRIFENSVVGLFQSTPEGRFISVNPAFAKMLRYESPQELIASISDIARQYYVDPDDRRRYQQILQRDGSVEGFEFEIRRRDGSQIWISNSTRAYFDKDGKVVCYEGIVMDISQRKQAEKEKEELHAQLLQARKMESLGTLAGGIAHEFNNILGIIIGNTELALDDVPRCNPPKDYLQEIRVASLRAKEVVRQILRFVRKMPSETMPILISTVVRESLHLMRSTIPQSIRIHQNILCTSEMILANPTEINQVLINLCTNAMHAMSNERGTLSVRLEPWHLDASAAAQYNGIGPGVYAKLTVTDTGSGIQPEILDRVFEPYFTTKDVDKGLGMGLAVVYGIVKNCDGAIDVQSKFGLGTTVEVLFPVITPQAEKEVEKADVLPSGTERILFVDDEISLVIMTKDMLERLGYHVVGVSSSLDALQRFRENPQGFALVITDMAMPEMPGDRLAQELLHLRPDVPIILCTGHSDRMDKNKAKTLGIMGYLLKPLEMKKLAQTVREVLDEAKTRTPPPPSSKR